MALKCKLKAQSKDIVKLEKVSRDLLDRANYGKASKTGWSPLVRVVLIVLIYPLVYPLVEQLILYTFL